MWDAASLAYTRRVGGEITVAWQGRGGLSFRCEQNSGTRARGGRERRKTFAYKRDIADEGASGAVWWRGLWVVCECAAAEFPKSSIANFSVCVSGESSKNPSRVWNGGPQGGVVRRPDAQACLWGGWGESGRPPPAQNPHRTARRCEDR